MAVIWNQGMMQQTAAVQLLQRKVSRAAPARRARGAKRSKPSSARPKKRRKMKTAARKGAKFVKGSAAAKRHMAKLRKMVKRR